MKKGWIIGIGVFLLLIGIVFDKQILNFIINHRVSSLNGVMSFISILGSALFVFVFSTLLFGFDKEGRKYIPALWLTLVLALASTLILKYIIARPRPLVQALQIKTDYSFPSAHAAAIFAPLLLVDKLFPKLKWMWLSIGILVLFARMYLGVHYMSDVIGGALLGYLFGIVVLRITKINF